MSTAEETFRKFESVAETWISSLEKYTPEQFARKPSDEEWSIGQVYNHLIQAANYMQLRGVDACLAGNGCDAGRNANAEAVFAAGGFPPIQIKVPGSPQYTPAQPESIEQMRDGMKELVERMRSLAPGVAGHNPEIRSAHPAFGGLNADEWYRLVEMHFRHHLHQKGRLDAWLAAPMEVAG